MADFVEVEEDEPLAPVLDIATGERIVPPAVAQEVLEDSFGRYVMVDGQRIPVRNGGTLPGLTPLEDWQIAREVGQEIVAGEGIYVETRSWFGSVLSVATNVGGWTTYRLAPEPWVATWLASLVAAWLPWSLWLTWQVSHWGAYGGLMGTLAFVGAPFLLWTRFCVDHTELARPPR